MNEQLQPLKKPVRTGKAGRSGTQDDIVYAHIFEAILEQRLAPGTKLSEEALGEIFGVSRTIIRRALSRLAHESVVLRGQPRRGGGQPDGGRGAPGVLLAAHGRTRHHRAGRAARHLEQLNELRQMVRSATASPVATVAPASACPANSTSSWPKRRAMRRW
jgi:DNA-binding FadR family transcriptional regulator